MVANISSRKQRKVAVKSGLCTMNWWIDGLWLFVRATKTSQYFLVLIIFITSALYWAFFFVCNSAPQRTGSAKQMFKSSHLWSVSAVATAEISVILLELIKHIRSKHSYSSTVNCLSTFKCTSSCGFKDILRLTTRTDANAYASLFSRVLFGASCCCDAVWRSEGKVQQHGLHGNNLTAGSSVDANICKSDSLFLYNIACLAAKRI